MIHLLIWHNDRLKFAKFTFAEDICRFLDNLLAELNILVNIFKLSTQSISEDH